MSLKTAVRSLLAAAVVLVTAAPAQALTYDEIVAGGVLTVGVYRDFPPFSSETDGRLVGIDVDLGRALAERMGLKATFLQLTADENIDDDLRNGVWKGSVTGGGVADVMLHMPVDRALNVRNDLVVLFGAYYRDSFLVARDPVRTGGVKTLAVFAHEPIGVEVDSLADTYLSGAFGGVLRAKVTHFLTTEEAVGGLVGGRVAGVMAPVSQLEAGLRDHRDRFEIAAVPTPGLPANGWDVGMAVKHTNRDLAYAVGDVVDALEADGTLARIFADHGVTWRKPEH
ncbi:MAG: transporter substrate-binding domain-containing protein [Caenispirillum sp.]|nr:transporter substrate-binding domain-containing protein [Caenispirillum sp.]